MQTTILVVSGASLLVSGASLGILVKVVIELNKAKTQVEELQGKLTHNVQIMKVALGAIEL